MFSLSTGEPPTPPSLESDNGQQSRSVPSSLVRTQELDSGYVPSPAAVCDPSGELYFFDRSFVPPTAVSSEESLCCDVFDDVIECVLLHDSNFCSDCGESVPCTCSRTESSATVRASTPRNCVMDSNVCDSDGQSPTARTSSMPIIIPRSHNERQERPSPSNNIVVPPRISFAQLRDLMCSRTHPGGFPSRYIQWLNRVHPSELRSLEEERDAQQRAAEGSRTRNRRNWRRQIDSDFSDSSDDDDNSCSVETEGRSHPVVMSALMARDLFSSSEEPSDPVVVNARTRSQSINLPPQEETLRHVGRVLRRLSEDFEQSRGIRTDQRRRGSISRFFNSLS